MLTVEALSRRLEDLGSRARAGNPADAFARSLDNLLPQDAITTHEWAVAKRKVRGPTGELVDFDPDLTPYSRGIADACDQVGVRVVAVKGPARGVKTITAENKCLRHWDVGPLYNVLWFMQDEDSIKDYIDERGEDMLRIHAGVNARIDWSDRRNSRTRKRIGRSTVFYRPATMRTTRGRAAPLIVADEIDAYQKRVRDAIMGLIENRQREFGNSALAFLASHPDAGPTGGIDAVLRECLQHLWWACCPNCGRSASPAREAPIRWGWNVPALLLQNQELDRPQLLDMIEQEARIFCPHEGCGASFDNSERLPLMGEGTWLQPHQTLTDGVIEGDALVRTKMGFVIHGFMAPFVDLQKTARDWSAAKLEAENGNPINLKERTVKDLGETFETDKDEEKTEDYKVVQKRLTNVAYEIKTVPRGVDFLTSFVDVQGDRFEVRVIGWSRWLESWLIDAYAIKQWPAFGKHAAFENIDPGNRLGDWDIIEDAVLGATYPLAHREGLWLPIAKTAVNNAGAPGFTNLGRVWLANLLAREDGRQVAPWQVQLFQGAASKGGETYGRPSKPLLVDDANKPLATSIRERMPNVHDIKKIIIRRMKIENPGPGAMHLPLRLSRRYAMELVAERLVDGDWVRTGANETWDGWVACEAARAWLQPDRPGLWDERPDWATPMAREHLIDTQAQNPLSLFDRLAQVNADT